jgi:hypothetical protein
VKKLLTAETAETAEKKSLRILGVLCVLCGKRRIFSHALEPEANLFHATGAW